MSLPRLRAPRDDGQILAVPPLEQAGSLLSHNLNEFAAAQVELLGKPLAELRQLARRETWAAVQTYHAEAGEPLPAAPLADQPWLVAGHQPELFHPGVWFKNFALKGLAQRHGAFSLNLVVDNDVPHAARLHVPADAHRLSLPYDRSQGEAPYEERVVLDEAQFASLPERVEPLTRRWPFRSLLPECWAAVLQQAERTPLLGERFAAGRRAMERRWGLLQAELPLSRVCQTEAFAWFACQLLFNACRLLEVYNGAVHAYRRRYGIHSVYHPVPDLVCDGAWCELPLWAWRSGQRRRARLFARRGATSVQLRAGTELWPTLDLSGDPQHLVAQWRELERQGCKVRTRALTTTLFGRLLLGDLFLHGIGGGKYDELTDALIPQFFGCPVPGFLVVTATLLLPLPRYPVDVATGRQLARAYRDVCWNPQRHLHDGDAAELAAEKASWLTRTCVTRAERRERFVKLRELNERLRPFVAAKAQQLHEARDVAAEQLRVNAILGRRDYSFALYPEALLRNFYAGAFTPQPL